ncbi:PilZ domain-containing protein [Chthonobacter albigriseus]|uniref:PilZ domain-containing protein n=1 Tax=Chthonobacter albigriseus TaxID=1683161 RepID=UPI0015EE4341|nr:PilZ domain-containing protein [Chthonobacter albigriseus]
MKSLRSFVYRSTYAAAVRERRAAKRYHGSSQVRVKLDGTDVPAAMVDVSLTGFRLRCGEPHDWPEKVEIFIVSLGFTVSAALVWRDSDQTGWRFLFNTRQVAQIQALIRAQAMSRYQRLPIGTVRWGL